MRFFIICMLTVAMAVCCSGCVSTGFDEEGLGERNSYVRGQLDSTIRSLDRELTAGNESLRKCVERSGSIEDGARRLKELLRGYFEVVERIQEANSKALAKCKVLEESLHNSIPDSASSSSGGRSGALPGADKED